MKTLRLASALLLAFAYHGMDAYAAAKSAAKPGRTRSIVRQEILKPQKEESRFNQPSDLIELVPILRDINRMIPRSFSIRNHKFKLSSNRLVIEQQTFNALSRSLPKTSIISFSYFGGLGGDMSTHIEVPLLYSPFLSVYRWFRYPVGNYTVTIDRNSPQGSGAFFLYARAWF